ncbi:MAG: SLC13 family permease [Candidatus Thermoplasmatota archaeon]|nr:SLC13 family permease [Candidatus Thermoplasmatota archaeon]
MQIDFTVSLIVFIAVMMLVVARPRHFSIAIPPIIGAFILIFLRVIAEKDILYVISIVWNATITLIAIIFLSLILDEIGFFRYIAIRITLYSRGKVRRLFFLIVTLTSLVTALFSNDGSIVVMTPIMYAILRETGAPRKLYLPFLVSVGFVADATSLPLSISNLVNIISVGFFSIPFLEYAKIMVLPDIVAIVSSAAVLYLIFHNTFPSDISLEELPRPEDVVKDMRLLKVAFATITLMITLYAITGYFLVPISFIAVPGVALFYMYARIRTSIPGKRIVHNTPWEIIFFALGLFIVVYALSKNGLVEVLGSTLSYFSYLYEPLRMIVDAFIFSFLASIMNNLPSVITVNLTIIHLHQNSLVYLNVLANDIGTKFTPIGSLATLLWMNILRQKGEKSITYRYFVKIGIIVTPPVLVLSVLTLWLVQMI